MFKASVQEARLNWLLGIASRGLRLAAPDRLPGDKDFDRDAVIEVR